MMYMGPFHTKNKCTKVGLQQVQETATYDQWLVKMMTIHVTVTATSKNELIMKNIICKETIGLFQKY